MGYKKEKGTFLSSDNKSNIAYYVYTPEANPSGIVHIVHGMAEYAERYDGFAAYLAENGIVALLHDQIGHGNSVASEEDYGYFGESDGFASLTDDIEKVRLIIRKRYRLLPYILFGHGMGSLVVRRYISIYGGNIDGCVMCGTAGPDAPTGIGTVLTKIIGAFKGSKHRSELIKKISLRGYNSRFPREEGEYAWLTKDRATRDFYKNDKRCGFTYTIAGYRDLFALTKEVSGDNWAGKIPKSLPVLIISGKDDPVGNYGEGPRKIYSILEDNELNELRIIIYESCRHEILNENAKDNVQKDVLDWVRDVIAGVVECRRI